MAAANRCSGRSALSYLLVAALCVISMMTAVPIASASVIDESIVDAENGRSLQTIGLLGKLFRFKVGKGKGVHRPVYHAPVYQAYGKKGRKLMTIGLLGKLFHGKLGGIVHKPVYRAPVYHAPIYRAPVYKAYGKKGRKMMNAE